MTPVRARSVSFHVSAESAMASRAATMPSWGEAIELGKLGKMFSRFEASDLCRIVKTKPRGIHLSDGADARTAGAQGFFEFCDRIADAREHANAG